MGPSETGHCTDVGAKSYSELETEKTEKWKPGSWQMIRIQPSHRKLRMRVGGPLAGGGTRPYPGILHQNMEIGCAFIDLEHGGFVGGEG